MNRYIAFVPIAILILAGSGVVSQAFASFAVTMYTDKEVYDHASNIVLTGNVYPVDVKGSNLSLIIVSPLGGIADIQQISVNSDGSFSTTINTSTKYMSSDGIYEIRAQYGDYGKTSVSVELTNAIETSEDVVAGTAVTGIAESVEDVTSVKSLYDISGQIEYEITCNATLSFFANGDDDSIVIYLDPTNDGIIKLTLDEELIKPFSDGTFAVIADNEEIQDFTQVGNTLTIPCLAGMEKIEIYGSWAIPEFGVIAAMILAVAIVSIIVVTAKTRLSIVPRY